MIRRALIAALMATVLGGAAASAVSADSGATEPSLERQVAVFVASNMKISVDNALAQLTAIGLDCDTAAVRTMILEELGRPYDRAAHDAANRAIDAAMSRMAAEQAELMLAQAAAEDGARVLPDGLVYRELSAGDASAASPAAESTVSFRYRGSLPDGSVFDAIEAGDAPMTARVGDLTPGMAEGLTLMKPGGRAVLTMPAALGYGAEGVPGVIPPDCPLRFEVELVSIDD